MRNPRSSNRRRSLLPVAFREQGEEAWGFGFPTRAIVRHGHNGKNHSDDAESEQGKKYRDLCPPYSKPN